MLPVGICCRWSLLVGLLWFPLAVWAGEEGAGDDEAVLARLAAEDPVDQAINRGLLWLRAVQNPNGAFQAGANSTAITGLGLLAHLSAGITPREAQAGPALLKAIQFILDAQDQTGYFGWRDGSRMYGHGISTLALSQVLGMTPTPALDERIRAALERAVRLTVAAAKVTKAPVSQGGWRYEPMEQSSDLSLSGWQMMSLHACAQMGIVVPTETIEAACAFGMRLTTADGQVGYAAPGEDHPALRGLALLCFAFARQDEQPAAKAVAERIRAHPAQWQGPFLFYRIYYDAIGLARVRPDLWATYRPGLERLLLSHQHEEGYWLSPPGDNESQVGRAYLTSMAVLTLAVERQVLPAHQR